jgi:hypothetical protein
MPWKHEWPVFPSFRITGDAYLARHGVTGTKIASLLRKLRGAACLISGTIPPMNGILQHRTIRRQASEPQKA